MIAVLRSLYTCQSCNFSHNNVIEMSALYYTFFLIVSVHSKCAPYTGSCCLSQRRSQVVCSGAPRLRQFPAVGTYTPVNGSAYKSIYLAGNCGIRWRVELSVVFPNLQFFVFDESCK